MYIVILKVTRGDYMELSQLYIEKLLIRMAHHSTAIEGNPLTEAEVRQVVACKKRRDGISDDIPDGTLDRMPDGIPEDIPNCIPDGIFKGTDSRAYEEVRNYTDYVPYLMTIHEQPISLQIIKETHRHLMQGIAHDAGAFKTIHNVILGANFTPTEPYLVVSELKNWCDTLAYRLEIAKTLEETVEAIMEQHLRFERIHPFSDGNGRTGRALIVHSCLQQNIPPMIIPKEMGSHYIQMMGDRNVRGLTEIGLALIREEMDL